MQDERLNSREESEQQPSPEAAEPQGKSALPEPTESDLLFEKVEELEATVEQLKDQLLRKAAEFENYKRRIENESIDRIRFANEGLIARLLPVIDDFDRLFKSGTKLSADTNALMKGVELIYQKFQKVLSAEGLAPYDVIGKAFDPALHDALMQTHVPGAEPNAVVTEVERGYMLNGKVIRHAKVVVAADMPQGEPNSTPQSGKSDDQQRE